MSKIEEFSEWAHKYHGWYSIGGNYYKDIVKDGVTTPRKITWKKVQRYYNLWDASN